VRQTVENQERDFHNFVAAVNSNGPYRVINGQVFDTRTLPGYIAPPPAPRATRPAAPLDIPRPRPDPLGAPFTLFQIGHRLGTFTYPPGPPRPENRTTAIPVEWPSLEPRSTAALQPGFGDINFPPTFTSRRRTHNDAFGDELEPELNPRPRGPQGTPADTGPATAGPSDYFEATGVSPPVSDTSGGDAPRAAQEDAASTAEVRATTTAVPATDAPATAPFNPIQPLDSFFDDDADRPATETAAAFEDQLRAEEEKQ
jgi:hypothetical protein